MDERLKTQDEPKSHEEILEPPAHVQAEEGCGDGDKDTGQAAATDSCDDS